MKDRNAITSTSICLSATEINILATYLFVYDSSEPIIVTYHIIQCWYTGSYIGYSKEGPGRTKPLLAVPNVTAHPSTASVLITVMLYNGPLLCGLNVPIKG